MLDKEQQMHLSIAMTKAWEGHKAEDIIFATALNMGATIIDGKEGETIPFDPIQHQDLLGGLLPGDLCLVRKQGFFFPSGVCRRSLVESVIA